MVCRSAFGCAYGFVMDDREQKLKSQALTCACIDQDVAALTRLLLDPVYLSLIDRRGFGGNAPIHIAVLSKNMTILSLLLDAGADRNRRNSRGDMPMHCACRVGFLEGLRLLCSFRRIVTDGLNDDGYLPIDLASSNETASLLESDLYGIFNVQKDKINTSIIDLQGRKECQEFLTTVSAQQEVDRMNDYFDETVELNRRKQKVTNILRDSNKGRSKIFYANFLKPPAGTIDCWNDRDYQIFQRSMSLFKRMIVSVGSVCLVNALMATTILAYDEKKAVEHQLWLYSRRKELDKSASFVSGVSKNREFFKTPVAESGKRDNLPEYDYTSYDIDDIMSDEEAEYIEATDDLVTSMLLMAMQATTRSSEGITLEISEKFVADILQAGLNTSSKAILSTATQNTFSNFSQSFIESIITSGLKQALSTCSSDAQAFNDSVLTQTLKTASEKWRPSDSLSCQMHTVAQAFVGGVLSASGQDNLLGVPKLTISTFSEKLVEQLIGEGLRSYQPQSARVVPASEAVAAVQFVEKSLNELAEDNELIREDAVAAFAKSFVGNIIALQSQKATNSFEYITIFSSTFVNHIILAAAQSPQTPANKTILSSIEASVAESFVKMVLQSGLHVFDEDMTGNELETYVEDIVESFSQPDHSGLREATHSISSQFVSDIIAAGMAEMLVNKFPHSSKDKSPSRAVIVTAISPDYSSDLRAFVTKIAGQFIADGMVLLVDQKSPMPTEDNPKFSTFVNSFVSDLFIQGLNTSVHRMNALSAIDSRNTIFVTSR